MPGFYPWMTAREYLALAGRLFGLAPATLDARADALLEMAGLASVTTRVGGFSRGMKQRLGIAQALINAPSLLMLDEPTSALDPIGRREVLEMVASLRGRTTVFFSTHILTDIERVCDAVAILEGGRIVTSASIAELTARATANRLVVEVDERRRGRDAPHGASVAQDDGDRRALVAHDGHRPASGAAGDSGGDCGGRRRASALRGRGGESRGRVRGIGRERWAR